MAKPAVFICPDEAVSLTTNTSWGNVVVALATATERISGRSP
ncbi:MAG: hypothetical protein RR184_19550 [Citrobacter sp.]